MTKRCFIEQVFHFIEIPALFLPPLSLALAAFFQIETSGIITLLVVILTVFIFFGSFESFKPRLGQLMPVVVLAALSAFGRVVLAPIPGVQPISALCILAGCAFGKRCGFMVGAISVLVSNFFLGQGPWTFWQMYSFGLMGYLAGALQQVGFFKHKVVFYVVALLMPLAFGFVMNAWYVISFVQPLTVESVVISFAVGIPNDIVHSICTLVLLLFLYVPCQKKFERIKKKYNEISLLAIK